MDQKVINKITFILLCSKSNKITISYTISYISLQFPILYKILVILWYYVLVPWIFCRDSLNFVFFCIKKYATNTKQNQSIYLINLIEELSPLGEGFLFTILTHHIYYLLKFCKIVLEKVICKVFCKFYR